MTTWPVLAEGLFQRPVELRGKVYLASHAGASVNEVQTIDAFSEKWVTLEQEASDENEAWKQAQFEWYARSYGFADEAAIAGFLSDKTVVLDAGCGPGYKSAWLARLAPQATVVAMDLSDSIFVAAQRYGYVPNLVFVKGDIATTPFCNGVFDLVSCDQVLHHTENPRETVREFIRILRDGGILNTYVYARKALPRELLDEHFRELSKTTSSEDIWALSDQLTQLGKVLSELEIKIDVVDMPLLGIKGGKQDLQRFIYWNFLKCYWNADQGFEASKMTNFDWYAPSTAFRFTRAEFEQMVERAGFRAQFLHSEEACHTGRFVKESRPCAESLAW